MRTPRRSLALAFVLAVPAFAYEHALSATSARNAYFLGAEHDNQTAEFCSSYTHSLPIPKTGPHVSVITIETPFFQAVDRSFAALNYSALDSEQQFVDKPIAIRVRIEIDLTATFTQIASSDMGRAHLRSGDFWRDFTFKLIQGTREIPAQKVDGNPIYLASDNGSTLSGAIITLEYPADAVSSKYTTVQVLTPDGQNIKTGFDLAKLR